MHTKRKKATTLPNSLNQVKKRFEIWRQTHPSRTRFSEDLWSSAVAMAREYGHNYTTRALGLDYYSLKKRLEDSPTENRGVTRHDSSFIELIPQTHRECSIEIEDIVGRKMRISLKNSDIPDLALLCRSFCMQDTCSR